MGADETRDGEEHAGELAVGLDVGVVDVNLVCATQVLDPTIVSESVSRTAR